MRVIGSLLKIRKGQAKAYSYKCFVSRGTAETLGVEESDGLLLRFRNNLFPTVFHKHRTKANFTYAFTVPRNIGDVINEKIVEFELVKTAKRKRKLLTPKGQVDLLMNIRDRTRRNQPFYAFDLGEKVYVWIYSRGSKGFALNRYVPLESKARFDFFELMGAFHCEGKKARKKGEKNLDSMIFGNGDPEQILWFAESLEQFGFSKKDFRLQILHNKTQDVELLRDFWLSRGFFQDKVNLYENETVKSEKGVCLLAISGVVIGELFHELLEIAKRLAVRNKQNALRFFRGLSRGDIGISASRGKIGSISYTTENHENAVFFRNICRKIDIESSKEFFTPGVKGFWSVNITGYNNFKKLLLNGAIAHSKRKRKLLRLFFGMRNSRLDEYLKTVKDGKLTSRKIADALSISIVSSRAFLQKLRREGYVKKKNIGQAFRYSLTVNGVKRLVEFERIKKEMAG